MYVSRLLFPGEEISLLRHPHPVSVGRIAIGGALLLLAAFGLLLLAASVEQLRSLSSALPLLQLLGTQPQIALGWLALVVLLAGLLLCWIAWLVWRSTEYAVIAGPDGGRLVKVSGVFNKQMVAAPLNKINDLVLLEPLWGRILGYGALEVKTGNDYSGQLLRYVPDPRRFYSLTRALRSPGELPPADSGSW